MGAFKVSYTELWSGAGVFCDLGDVCTMCPLGLEYYCLSDHASVLSVRSSKTFAHA